MARIPKSTASDPTEKTETKERILSAALRLFNSQGTAGVSTNHIAEAAGLSVGNLYYHFKNKEEIVRALYKAYGSEFRNQLVLPDRPPILSDLEMLLSINQRILWSYRFFLREIGVLLQRDKELATEYRHLREQGMACVFYFIEEFVKAGILKDDLSEHEKFGLAQSVVFVGESFLPFVEAGEEHVDDSGNGLGELAMAQSVQILKMILRPYLLGEAMSEEGK